MIEKLKTQKSIFEKVSIFEKNYKILKKYIKCTHFRIIHLSFGKKNPEAFRRRVENNMILLDFT